MRKTILRSMEKKNISQRHISNTIGVSVGVINKFLKQEKEIAFDIIWEIVRLVEPYKVVEIMDACSFEVTKKNIMLALEYYTLNRRLEAVDRVLERAKKGNAEIQEWGRIYTIFSEHQRSRFSIKNPDNILRLFRRVDTPYKETRIILFILEIYSYYFNDDFKLLHNTLLNLPNDVMEIKHPFLRRCYLARINELMCHVEIKYKNNGHNARIHCDSVLQHCISDNLNATAYFIKGLSYLIEDFDKCILNYNICLDYYKRINRIDVAEDVKYHIGIAYVLWDEDTDFTSEFHKRLADVKKGLSDPNVLDRFKSTENTPYIYLIKGIALNDTSYLFRSLHQFRKKGDSFRANLAGVELAKRGIDQQVLMESIAL